MLRSIGLCLLALLPACTEVSPPASIEPGRLFVVGSSNTDSDTHIPGHSPICPLGSSPPVPCADDGCPLPEVPGGKWIERFAGARPAWQVTNLAVSGTTLEPKQWTPHCQLQTKEAIDAGATHLLVACGINDLIFGTPAEAAFGHLMELVALWTKAGHDRSSVWVATLPIMYPARFEGCLDHSLYNDDIRDFNERVLATFARERILRHDHLSVGDMQWSTCTEPADMHCYDGLHGGDGLASDPDDGMQVKWAAELLRAIP
jgi:hypothetical protein